MKRLTLTLRGHPDRRIDLSPLAPHLLAGKTAREIERTALDTSRGPLALGELFRVRMGAVETICFDGGSDRLDRVGEAMTGGEIVVEGDVGVRAGRLMSGGRLDVRGDAGPWAGSAMAAGVIAIAGAAGARLGAPLAGEMAGMRGGIIVVRGSAGERAGDRMRRGTIIVEGEAGPYAGSRMIAGTLIVGRKAGALPGFLLKRGSILLGGGTSALAPTFVDCGRHELLAMKFLARMVEPYSKRSAALMRRPLTRLAGDMAVLGKGEILL